MMKTNIVAFLLITVLIGYSSAAAVQRSQDSGWAKKTRYQGAVAVWYGSHFENTGRHDWEPIKRWNGPFHPLLGEYKTDDRKIIRQHLQWLRRAGVDVIFYDVARIEPELTLFDLPKQKTLQLLVEELSHQEKEPRKLQLVLWIEKWNSNPTAEQYRFALDFIRMNLVPHDFYFRFEGKPLVVRYFNDPAPDFSEIDRQYEQFFTLRRISSSTETKDWAYFGPTGNRECMTVNPGADGYMEDAFISKYVNGKEVDAAALRKHGKVVVQKRAGGKNFEKQLLKARQTDPKMIFISGWNDWAWCLQIEPAKEYGLKYVDMAARLLGRESETLSYRKP